MQTKLSKDQVQAARKVVNAVKGKGKKSTPKWLVTLGVRSAKRQALSKYLQAHTDVPVTGKPWERAKQQVGIV